jgi:hypothetical protein
MTILDTVTDLATILTAMREDFQNDNDAAEFSSDIFDPIKECDEYHDWSAKRDAEALHNQIQDQLYINGGNK